MNYFIKNIKYYETEEYVSPGYSEEFDILSLEIMENDKTYFLTNVGMLSYPAFYLTDNDISNNILKREKEDEEFEKYLDERKIDIFKDINLDSYESIINSIIDTSDKELAKLFKLIIHLMVNNDNKEIKKYKMKYIKDLKINITEDIKELVTESDY